MVIAPISSRFLVESVAVEFYRVSIPCQCLHGGGVCVSAGGRTQSFFDVCKPAVCVKPTKLAAVYDLQAIHF